MLISVAIPVFRNEGSLPDLHKRIVDTIATIPDADYEIIFTNDGSDDGSLVQLIDISKNDPKVTVINLSRNFGQHAANNAAFKQVKGDIIINMSADLQDPPEIIADIVNKMNEGHDIVLAARKKVRETWFKRLTSWAHYRLIRISVPAYPDKGFDFWGANKKAFKAFMSYDDVVRRNQTDLLSIGYSVGTITYEKQKRVHGKSQYKFLKRLDISLSQILATAIWPLRIAAIMGFAFTLSGFLYATYLFISYFFREAPFEGWTPIMILLLIIGGSIMLVLGIIGEYLWLIYYETKNRPIYFINQVYRNGEIEDE